MSQKSRKSFKIKPEAKNMKQIQRKTQKKRE
jgi:hypothetical protein